MGIPHTLGILLHGPPGTGKTSFIKSIAKYTNKHIHLLNFDASIELAKNIFSQSGIIIFEDVDRMEESEDEGKLDMSILLNLLDGLNEGHGRIVIMTSNHPDKLDPALRRPGRIDIDLKMDYATKDDVENILKLMFKVNVELDFELKTKAMHK
ncbi:hypothetical protein GEMRC1_000522 [Eukaryota sp. GEM-RC1]